MGADKRASGEKSGEGMREVEGFGWVCVGLVRPNWGVRKTKYEILWRSFYDLDERGCDFALLFSGKSIKEFERDKRYQIT